MDVEPCHRRSEEVCMRGGKKYCRSGGSACLGAREVFFEPIVFVFVFCVDFISLARACPFTNEEAHLLTVDLCVGGDVTVCGADATRSIICFLRHEMALALATINATRQGFGR